MHGLLHLLYADDRWAVATGSHFWMKLLFWMFVLDVIELPVSWHKVNGGPAVDWIGYHLDVHQYILGMNRKQQWINKWIGEKLQQGGVVGEE